MRVEGTLFKVERSAGVFTPPDGREPFPYDNVLITLTTDDYQIVEFKVKATEMPSDAPALVQGQRYAAEVLIPKGTKLGLRSISAAAPVSVDSAKRAG